MHEKRLLDAATELNKSGGLTIREFIHIAQIALLMSEQWLSRDEIESASSIEEKIQNNPKIRALNRQEAIRALGRLWAKEAYATATEGEYLIRELNSQLLGQVSELFAFADKIDEQEQGPTPCLERLAYDIDGLEGTWVGRPDARDPERLYDQARTDVFPKSSADGHLVVPNPKGVD